MHAFTQEEVFAALKCHLTSVNQDTLYRIIRIFPKHFSFISRSSVSESKALHLNKQQWISQYYNTSTITCTSDPTRLDQQINMKYQLITLITIAATVIALPAPGDNHLSSKREVTVCTEATIGQECLVINVNSKQ